MLRATPHRADVSVHRRDLTPARSGRGLCKDSGHGATPRGGGGAPYGARLGLWERLTRDRWLEKGYKAANVGNQRDQTGMKCVMACDGVMDEMGWRDG
eukprot:gene20401-biopygen8550